MLCQKCHEQPATVFFSQTINNETTQAHLCESCAQEKSQSYGGANPFNNPFATLSEFLNNFMSWDENVATEVNSVRSKPKSADPQLQCPHCGYQLATFRQNGRLGCTQCYESFKSVLEPLISSIHGNVRHIHEEQEPPIEKTSGTTGASDQKPEVKALREKIKEAIQNEKFEEAARLRDLIKEIEGK